MMWQQYSNILNSRLFFTLLKTLCGGEYHQHRTPMPEQLRHQCWLKNSQSWKPLFYSENKICTSYLHILCVSKWGHTLYKRKYVVPEYIPDTMCKLYSSLEGKFVQTCWCFGFFEYINLDLYLRKLVLQKKKKKKSFWVPTFASSSFAICSL